MSRQPSIGYVGMTHLGLCSAIAAASKGFVTLGFDDDAALVARLDAGVLPVVEPGLEELLSENRSRIAFTSDVDRLHSCDVINVAPDVPTDDGGKSDLTSLDRLLALVLDRAHADASIVVLSQVPPGFTRSRARSGRLLYYQVETLIFGRAVERAIRPERFIVGCFDAATPLPRALFAFLEAFSCPILPMRLESAELAKISINCCLVASVSVANTLAELCERVGADWSEIEPALKLDRRIGQFAYLTPGLGLAGGNLERDLATVLRLSEATGTDASVIRAFSANSAHRKDWPIRTLHQVLLADAPCARLGVLGLAYKENTHSTKNSPSLALIGLLAPWPVQAYDPVVDASKVPHPDLKQAGSALEAATGVDALAIMTPWPEFRSLEPAVLAAVMRGKLVLDPYGVLDRKAARAAGLDHRSLGVN